MAGALGVESVLLLFFTYLSAPPPTALSTGAVHWLQVHLGTSRFLTLGPIQPNYGSYFGIAQYLFPAQESDTTMMSKVLKLVSKKIKQLLIFFMFVKHL